MFARVPRWLLVLACAFFSLGLDRTAAAAPSDEEVGEGFVSLFDGKTFDGWMGNTEGYAIEDGAMVCIPDRGGNVFTKGEYADFVLRFEFKMEPGANNGLGIRAPTDQGDVAYTGMELQILDDGHEAYKDIRPYQSHGSVYGIVAAKRGHLKPAGEWNEQEVTCVGRKIQVVLNGETIVDADLDEATKDGTLDGRDHPGVRRASGHIGFLGHGARVEFRALRVKEIK